MSEITPSEQKSEEEPKVEIKEYSDDYKEQVKDLIYNVYDKERGRQRTDRPDLDIIKEVYQDNNGNFWVAFEEGKAIGSIGLINYGEGAASAHRFCVEKEFRGKGVSEKLYSAFLDFATSHGLKKIFLGTTSDAKAAIRFYEKNGWAKIEHSSLPENVASRSYMSKNDIFYELDLKNIEHEK